MKFLHGIHRNGSRPRGYGAHWRTRSFEDGQFRSIAMMAIDLIDTTSLRAGHGIDYTRNYGNKVGLG